MLVIGMCGGSGSGKGTVCSVFAKRGIPSIDTDAVYHEITAGKGPCVDELTSEFGISILNIDGSLNRALLADKVFSSENAKARREVLERITHKHILDVTRRKLREYGDKGYAAAIVDAPLLFESGFDKECDKIIAVVADKSLRLARIMDRDGLTEERAIARINSQISDSELIKRADYVIENNSSREQLCKQAELISQKILEQL